MSAFTQALVVTPLSDGHSWVIVSRFSYDVGSENSGDRIEVAQGFVTDFATVPRLLWWFLPRWGTYGNAAVIHDWLYWTQARSRKESDDIMREAMGVLNVAGYKQVLIYWAVRLFGWWAWNRNRWDRESGFNRVIPDVDIKCSVSIGRAGILKKTAQQMGPS